MDRFLIFMQGWPLRFKYCHNTYTWKTVHQLNDVSLEKSVDDLFNEIIKYESYMKFSNGGVTVTGGEPMLQAEFLIDLFKRCRKAGIHTAIDTSGFILNDAVKTLLSFTDLVLMDIKHIDTVKYTTITGVELKPTLEFMGYVNEKRLP